MTTENIREQQETAVNMPYAVVYTYSFDSDGAVYLFPTYEKAWAFLVDNFQEEYRIVTEEDKGTPICTMDAASGCASITTSGIDAAGEAYEDICEYRVLNVYAV